MPGIDQGSIFYLLMPPQTEFEETILEDLNLLDIHGDQVTHTSDHFDELYELAVKLIKDGNAYTDDTEQAQVRLRHCQRKPIL